MWFFKGHIMDLWIMVDKGRLKAAKFEKNLRLYINTNFMGIIEVGI